MKQPYVEEAIDYARSRLERELAPQRYYHSLAHTACYVVPAAELFGQSFCLSVPELLLLRTAAWYHDLGFVQHDDNHEAASAAIAMEMLPHFGYTSAQVNTIVGMIFATRMPQCPHNQLEELLADADLESLGRADFLATSRALWVERAAYGEPITEAAWYTRQRTFLQNHHYFTAVARDLRDLGKRQNIELLTTLLQQLDSSGKGGV